MNKKVNKPNKRRVRRRALIQTEKCYRFAANRGTLCVFSYREGRRKQIGIYGDPKGLRYLARLLDDVADIDQTKVPDIHCPPDEGVHFTWTIIAVKVGYIRNARI